MSKIEYLSEIFKHLNNLNSNMQSKKENVLTATDKLVAFKKKVTIRKKRMTEDNLNTFPLVQKICVIPIIGEHLTCLENKIKQYLFSISIEEFDWIRNPFLDLSVISLWGHETSITSNSKIVGIVFQQHV